MVARCEHRGQKTRAVFAFASMMALSTMMPGCSVYMEATRPTPVDLAQFQAGQSRDQVVEAIGAPTGTTNESDGDACDSYQLYTHGYGAGGKAGLAVLEGAAVVFTLGLAEAVTTPVEGVTKNEKYPVLFCYKDGRLARLSESGKPLISSAPVADTAQANPNGAAQPAQAPQSSTVNALNPPKSTGAITAAPTQSAMVAKVAAPAATAPASAAPASPVSPAPAVTPAVDWQPESPATE